MHRFMVILSLRVLCPALALAPSGFLDSFSGGGIQIDQQAYDRSTIGRSRFYQPSNVRRGRPVCVPEGGSMGMLFLSALGLTFAGWRWRHTTA
jgi:hypothetical protein